MDVNSVKVQNVSNNQLKKQVMKTGRTQYIKEKEARGMQNIIC